MTRNAKLFAQLLDAFGFTLDRVRGSHHPYVNARIRQRLVIQPIGKEAKAYQVRQFLDMVEEYGLKLDEEA